MQDAPPQEVTIVGDDWEADQRLSLVLSSVFTWQDWEMGGPDKDARFNDVFEAGRKNGRKPLDGSVDGGVWVHDVHQEVKETSRSGGVGPGWCRQLLEEGQRGRLEPLYVQTHHRCVQVPDLGSALKPARKAVFLDDSPAVSHFPRTQRISRALTQAAPTS